MAVISSLYDLNVYNLVLGLHLRWDVQGMLELQNSTSKSAPGQSLPFWHVLRRSLEPPWHVALHELQLPHDPQVDSGN